MLDVEGELASINGLERSKLSKPATPPTSCNGATKLSPLH
jgi:hypothetical protein